jgi:hypothetical protein
MDRATEPANGRTSRLVSMPLVGGPACARAGLSRLSPGRCRRASGAACGVALIDLLIRGIRQVTVYLRRRRACLRMASTFAANAAGSMIGVPRHGDIDSRSVSLETMSRAPTSAARSRIRLSS